MKSQDNYASIAVLIDAENISVNLIEKAMTYIASSLGKIQTIRAYADWSNLKAIKNQDWPELTNKYAINTINHFNSATKNSSDFSLIIDAMDMLYSKNYDCFCIVSSDSDFQHINVRLRQANIDVYGFGESKASNCYQKSCTKFITLKPNNTQSKIDVAKTKKNTVIASNKPIKETKKYEALFKKAYENCPYIANSDYKALSQLLSEIKKIDSEFSVKSLGYSTISKLISTLLDKYFELDKLNRQVRLRNTSEKTNKVAS